MAFKFWCIIDFVARGERGTGFKGSMLRITLPFEIKFYPLTVLSIILQLQINL